jgi:hypothetical protein
MFAEQYMARQPEGSAPLYIIEIPDMDTILTW